MFRNNPTRKLLVFLVAASMVFTVSCGAQSGEGGTPPEKPDKKTEERADTTGGKTTMEKTRKETAAEQALAKAEVGREEATNMLPADGKDPDKPQPLPDNPPEGVKVYPATTNATVEGGIDYARTPPTNGDHDPLWQNCGFYPEPIDERTAVHSMDHGVVWISYRPNLPQAQIDELRQYAEEDYTIVAPYPNLPAPVVATAWRVQLELDGAEDPRLRQFVGDFKNTELAPLSGNRCEGGVGEPKS